MATKFDLQQKLILSTLGKHFNEPFYFKHPWNPFIKNISVYLNLIQPTEAVMKFNNEEKYVIFSQAQGE